MQPCDPEPTFSRDPALTIYLNETLSGTLKLPELVDWGSNAGIRAPDARSAYHAVYKRLVHWQLLKVDPLARQLQGTIPR